MRFAPRLDPRVLALIRRLDDRKVPIAEVSRRVGAAAQELGLPRPSYAHVRRIVLAERDHSDARRDVVEDVATSLARGRLPEPYRIEARLASRRRH